MRTNLGLIGKLRSGKSAVGDYLTGTHRYTQFAFGDELKRYYHELFGTSDGKPREGYQWFGQTMRDRDPEIWLRSCMRAVGTRHYDCVDYGEDPDEFRAVITDVRQQNEARLLKSEGYTLIRVTCPDALRIDRAIKSGDQFEYADLVHGTETDLDGWASDYTLDNGGTLDELYAQIDTLMSNIRKGQH